MVKFIDPTWNDEIHDNVNNLNLQNGVINIGNYCTVLPISSPEYRKKHPSPAKISVFEGVDEITFNITDDYDITYTLIIRGEEMKNPIVQREVGIVKTLQGTGDI